MDGKIYTCYVKLNPEMVQADGAVTGSKEEVLAWMKAKYGTHLDGEEEDRMMNAAAFFYEGDCTEFWLADGTPIFLAELLEDDYD